MEKLLEVYSNLYIYSGSASMVIVNPKVPVDDESEEESDSLPYTVYDTEIVSIQGQEEVEDEPVSVVAEVDVSSLSSIILCAVIVICCFVSVLRD